MRFLIYDLAADPTEMRNLAATMPDKVQRLSAQWSAWAQRSHVDPTRNPFQAEPAAIGKRQLKEQGVTMESKGRARRPRRAVA